MSIVSVNTEHFPDSVLDRNAAARHVRFLPAVFDQWVAAGLFPGPSVDGRLWTAADLDRAIEQLERFGFCYVPNKKPTEYTPLPNVHRTFVKLSDERKSFHYKRRGLRGPIYGEPNSPGFMRALIAKEREFAAARQAAQNTSGPPPEQPADQSPAAAQPSRSAPPSSLESVTRKSLNRRPGSPREVVLKMARRRAAVTQAEVARIIRAARQAGAAEVEVRLSDSTRIVVRLEPDNSLASDEEIVL